MRAFAWLISLLALTTVTFAADPSQTQDLTVKLPPFESVTLENGMRVLLMPRHSLPLLSFNWLLKSGGSIYDPVGKEGLAMLTAELLRKGTRTRTADQISQEVEFVGGALSSGATKDYATGSAEFLSKDSSLALDLIADTLINPIFPKLELEKLAKQTIDEIRQDKDVPNDVILRYFNQFLYGNHPYGHPSGGTEVSLEKATQKDVTRFYREHYGPSQLVLAIAGDFSPAEMRREVRKRFASWPRTEIRTPAIVMPGLAKGAKALIVEKQDTTQVFFRVGNVSLCRTNADWIPAQVVNLLFGGRFTSLLNSELRIKSGLTYHANSYFEEHLLPGSFSMYFYSGNQTAEKASKMAMETLKALHEKGLTPEQLQSAKAYIKGQFGPTLETNDQLADLLCELEFYGLGPDYINTYLEKVEKTSPADAQRVIREHFPLKDLRFVIIGQKELIDPISHELASEVQKKSLQQAGF